MRLFAPLLLLCLALFPSAGCGRDVDADIHTHVAVIANDEGAEAFSAASYLTRYGRRALPTIEGAMHSASPAGRKNLIMAGVTTDVCLIFPSIDAALEGFAVQAVMDASGSPSDLSEEFSRQRMHDAGVVLTATNTLMAEIAQDWSTPNGQQLIGLLFSDVFPALGAGIV